MGQGSVLEPIRFNLFISPLIGTKKILAYEDHNNPTGIGINKDTALADIMIGLFIVIV